MVLKRICIRSIPQTARYHYRVCFGLPLMNLVPRNSRLGWLMQVVTSLPHIDGGINVRRKDSFLHSLSLKPGPFQGDPQLKYSIASFLPSPPLPAPFSQGFWLQHSTSYWGAVGSLGSPTVHNVGVLGCNFVACNLVLWWFSHWSSKFLDTWHNAIRISKIQKNVSVFRTLGEDLGLWFSIYHPESTIVRRTLALTLYKRVFLSLSPHTCTVCPMFSLDPFVVPCTCWRKDTITRLCASHTCVTWSANSLFFCSFLYIKLFQFGVKVAFNNWFTVTHHKVNLLKFPLRSSSFERTDDTFVLLICFRFFHL